MPVVPAPSEGAADRRGIDMKLHSTLVRAAAVAGIVLAATATPTGAQPDPEDPGSTIAAETTTTTAPEALPPATAGEQPPPTAEGPPPTGAPATTGSSDLSETTEAPDLPATTDPPPTVAETTPSTETTPPVETTDAGAAAAEVDAAALVDPNTVPGNPTCASVEPPDADWTELKIDPPTAGVHTDGTLTVTLTIVDTPQGATITWSSNIGVDAVLVKGGPNANLYVYDPESTGDSGLHAPANDNGKWAGLSHVDFCYDASGPTSTTTTSTSTTTTSTSSTSTTAPSTTTTSSTSTTAPASTTTTSTTAPPTTTPPSTQPPTTPPPPTTPSPFGSAIGPVVLTEDLPRTGSNTGNYVIGGLALLALGAGLSIAAKKATTS